MNHRQHELGKETYQFPLLSAPWLYSSIVGANENPGQPPFICMRLLFFKTNEIPYSWICPHPHLFYALTESIFQNATRQLQGWSWKSNEKSHCTQLQEKCTMWRWRKEKRLLAILLDIYCFLNPLVKSIWEKKTKQNKTMGVGKNDSIL